LPLLTTALLWTPLGAVLMIGFPETPVERIPVPVSIFELMPPANIAALKE